MILLTYSEQNTGDEEKVTKMQLRRLLALFGQGAQEAVREKIS